MAIGFGLGDRDRAVGRKLDKAVIGSCEHNIIWFHTPQQIIENAANPRAAVAYQLLADLIVEGG
jgi:hypothetical protein